MSAYIVSDRTINSIVTLAACQGVTLVIDGALVPVSGNEQQVAALLLQANCDSVNYRYRESDNNTNGFTFEAETCEVPQVLSNIRCLSYQSCETPDWEVSPAAKFLRAVQLAAYRALPGYEETQAPADVIGSLVRYASLHRGHSNTSAWFQGASSYAITDAARWLKELADHAPKLAKALQRVGAPPSSVVALKACDVYEEHAQRTAGYPGSFAEAAIDAIRRAAEDAFTAATTWGMD